MRPAVAAAPAAAARAAAAGAPWRGAAKGSAVGGPSPAAAAWAQGAQRWRATHRIVGATWSKRSEYCVSSPRPQSVMPWTDRCHGLISLCRTAVQRPTAVRCCYLCCVAKSKWTKVQVHPRRGKDGTCSRCLPTVPTRLQYRVTIFLLPVIHSPPSPSSMQPHPGGRQLPAVAAARLPEQGASRCVHSAGVYLCGQAHMSACGGRVGVYALSTTGTCPFWPGRQLRAPDVCHDLAWPCPGVRHCSHALLGARGREPPPSFTGASFYALLLFHPCPHGWFHWCATHADVSRGRWSHLAYAPPAPLLAAHTRYNQLPVRTRLPRGALRLPNAVWRVVVCAHRHTAPRRLRPPLPR